MLEFSFVKITPWETFTLRSCVSSWQFSARSCARPLAAANFGQVFLLQNLNAPLERAKGDAYSSRKCFANLSFATISERSNPALSLPVGSVGVLWGIMIVQSSWKQAQRGRKSIAVQKNLERLGPQTHAGGLVSIKIRGNHGKVISHSAKCAVPGP